MKAIGFGIILLLYFFPVSSQFYQYGEEPGSVRWKKIESQHFVMVYPEGNKKLADKVMNLFEISYAGNSQQLNYSPKKIPVLLHFQTLVSNGFVVWAPKRIELFMHPDVDGYAQEWHNQLALHEYRHVVQIEKLNQGITKILTTILGQQGIGTAVGMIPFWFIEGDAVYAETSLSQSGRGRLPSFEMELKAQLMSDENRYSYDKAYLGSYKDFVPDYYRLGYQMVSYARYKHGNEIWSNALDHIGRNPYQIAPMYFFLRKYGLSSKKLYHNTMDFLKENWEESIENRKFEKASCFEKRTNNSYTSYNFPHSLADGSIIAKKSSLDQIDRIVRIYPNGHEEIIHRPGYFYSDRISINGDKIIWAEQIPHIRYRNKSFSAVKMLDINTGKITKLSSSSRYSSPSYSENNKLIVAIETSPEIDFNLVFISENGKLVHAAKSPENIQLMQPSWLPGKREVVLIGLGPQGKSIMEYDLENQIWKNLLFTGSVNISHPVSDGEKIYFNASWNGCDNIYSLNPANGLIDQLTYSQFGAFEPFVDLKNGNLVYSEYFQDGYHIIKRPFDDLKINKLNEDIKINEQAFFNYTDNIKPANYGNKYDTINYEEKKFGRLQNMFNIHSWAPIYFDYNNPAIDDLKLNPGFTLLSQNLLGTAISSLGYEYKDKEHFIHANFTYRGFFPVISLDYNYGGFPAIGTAVENAEIPSKVKTNANLNASMYLPMNLTRGKWNMGFTPSIRLSYNGTYLYSVIDSDYQRGLSSLEGRIFTYAYMKTAYRDLQPRWGIVFDGSMTGTPFENEFFGEISSLQTSIYLPGILRNHGIKTRYYKQWNNPKTFLYGNNKIPFPRGINPFLGLDMQLLSFDYLMPVIYPDLSAGSFLYLKRIRANLFTDYLEGDIFNFSSSSIDFNLYQTSGIEMYFDFHAFRFLFPFNLGLRYSYYHQDASYQLEGLFSIDINRF
jgi:hypothetical protein